MHCLPATNDEPARRHPHGVSLRSHDLLLPDKEREPRGYARTRAGQQGLTTILFLAVLAVASAGPTRTAGTSRNGVVVFMEADRLNYPARKRFSPEVSFALNERAMRRGRFPCS